MEIYLEFTSRDLDFPYKWDAGTSPAYPQIIGSSNKTLFNKHQGNDILCLIRSLAKTWSWTDEDTFITRAKQLEYIIMYELPEYIRNFAEIKRWVEDNYEVN